MYSLKPQIDVKPLVSGFLLMTFTILPILSIIYFWPDVLPDAGSNAIYSLEVGGVKLLPKTPKPTSSNTTPTAPVPTDTTTGTTTHLNTLLLILVASGGFLGSMIHVSSSFTAFVGAGKFNKRWLLWYIVKPISAAGLAIIVYFVFRAGLLNSSSETIGSINIYGIMSFAILTGMFSDIATLKLEEVFNVMFKPKDNLPDKLEPPRVSGIKPESFQKDEPNAVVIDGVNLEDQSIGVFIGGVTIEKVARRKNQISFDYKVPANPPASIELKVTYPDPTKSIYTKKVPIV